MFTTSNIYLKKPSGLLLKSLLPSETLSMSITIVTSFLYIPAPLSRRQAPPQTTKYTRRLRTVDHHTTHIENFHLDACVLGYDAYSAVVGIFIPVAK